MLTPTALLFAAMTATAAPQDSNRPPPPEASYTLTEGASATLAPEIRVTLDKITDSRCPPNVMCVRKGNIDYHFSLHAYGRDEVFTMNTDQPRYTPTCLHGVSLLLDAGNPPPPTREAGPIPAHPVHLQVVHNSQ